MEGVGSGVMHWSEVGMGGYLARYAGWRLGDLEEEMSVDQGTKSGVGSDGASYSYGTWDQDSFLSIHSSRLRSGGTPIPIHILCTNWTTMAADLVCAQDHECRHAMHVLGAPHSSTQHGAHQHGAHQHGATPEGACRAALVYSGVRMRTADALGDETGGHSKNGGRLGRLDIDDNRGAGGSVSASISASHVHMEAYADRQEIARVCSESKWCRLCHMAAR